jgi:phage-related tail fiber protein
MPSSVQALITEAGEAAAIAQDGLGLSLNITHMAIGSGQYTPTRSQTTLVNRREVAPVLIGSRIGSQLTVTATFQASLYAGAAYAVGEIGFYAGHPDSGGILFAVYSTPTRATPLRGGAITTNYTQQFAIALSGVPTGSVNVTFDPAAAAGLAALTSHLAGADPHSQYLLKAGGTMSGPLVLAGPATLANHPVTKAQFDARRARGDFVPALQFGGASAGIVYAQQAGRYVLDGDLLHLDAFIQVSNKGSSVGPARMVLTGVPNLPVGTFATLLSMNGMAGLTGRTVGIWNGASLNVDIRMAGEFGDSVALTNDFFTNTSLMHLSASVFITV